MHCSFNITINYTMFHVFTSTWKIIIVWCIFVLKILQQIHCVVLSSSAKAALPLVCWGREELCGAVSGHPYQSARYRQLLWR